MNNDIKNFIEENIEKIDKNRWEELYTDLKYIDLQLCGQFTTFLLDAGIDPAMYLKYIPDYYLYGCGIKEYVIPGAMISIGDSAFEACDSLTSVEIPNNVTSIGENAFAGCSKLTSIEIPDSVTNIGFGTFRNCISLKNIVISDSLTSVGAYAFWGCDSLTSIEIPNGVTSIGEGAFNDCTSLKSITIPNSVTSIGDYMFQDCNSLTSIKYLGSKKEAIKLGIGSRSKKTWREDSIIKRIICTDGEILL